MRRILAEPGTNKHHPIIPGSADDHQKYLPAVETDGFRSKQVAMGPASSFDTRQPIRPGSEEDSQRYLPGVETEGFRAKEVAVGPASSFTEYTPTRDKGIGLPVSGDGGRDYFE